MGKYSKVLTPEGLLDFWVEVAVVMLLITVALGVMVWIISRIWLWLLIGGVLILAGYVAFRVWRHRRDYW